MPRNTNQRNDARLPKLHTLAASFALEKAIKEHREYDDRHAGLKAQRQSDASDGPTSLAHQALWCRSARSPRPLPTPIGWSGLIPNMIDGRALAIFTFQRT